ncbi:uncharacterized protein LOC110629639 isoform X2 [Manihot esculenta]|uniref:Uncharacterized protein n=1 Tax=Manihot esculenta TaxID=3983 RepID=A0ACB7ID40_MANES|nr:uncharacterized protein LOC110629639 isoform X2 [Manihot esculenta]KAG8662286.1 hypothetical protein MANES_01G083200v8 [Manihot esculenta]
MHPRSYTVDSISKSQELASDILASSTPVQISSVCSSIDSFLHSHTADQSRHFFSLTFPTLICKLYGFCDAAAPPNGSYFASSNAGWMDIILQSNDSDLASRVFSLLSPNGVIFQSIFAVDDQSLVKYVFPIERLPEWARFVLASERDCQVLNNLCPLFRGKIKEDSIKGSLNYQVQLNVFEYFMFWFAYYPICKANCENLNNPPTKRTRKLNLESWTSSIPVFSHSKPGNEQKLEHNLYLRLLYAYLRAFVPILDLDLHQPYRSSLLHYGRGNAKSILLIAEFLVDTLVHYWLVDNDFSPLPVDVCKSSGLSFPHRSVLTETPPAPKLGEMVKLLVKYLNLSVTGVKNGSNCVDSSKWSRVSLCSFDLRLREFAVSVNDNMCVGASWNSWIQRPVYRFLLRTFLFCPVGTSIKNVEQVFLVWVSYLEPWKVELNDFAEFDATVDGLGKDLKKEKERSKEDGYSSLWQDYVLSNYLYYSSLIMHFIGFAHKFLHTDTELMVQMVLQVMQTLTSSKELTDLIKDMDAVFHSKQAGSSKLMLNSLHGYVPLILQQLQDWEDGLCEGDAAGSFLHENWNKDLRLFSDGEDGGKNLLQVSYLFGGCTVKAIPFPLEKEQHEHSQDAIFNPRKVGNQVLTDVKYKGDWMKRPISDNEVAWLAKLLVGLSGWLNENLGLNQAENSDGSSKWPYLEVASGVENVSGSSETIRMMLCAIGSWFLALGATVVRLMRKHGLRINLRILASKKIVLFFIMSVLFRILKNAFGLFHRV